MRVLLFRGTASDRDWLAAALGDDAELLPASTLPEAHAAFTTRQPSCVVVCNADPAISELAREAQCPELLLSSDPTSVPVTADAWYMLDRRLRASMVRYLLESASRKRAAGPAPSAAHAISAAPVHGPSDFTNSVNAHPVAAYPGFTHAGSAVRDDAHSVHAHSVHAHSVHAHSVHPHSVHASDGSAHTGFAYAGSAHAGSALPVSADSAPVPGHLRRALEDHLLRLEEQRELGALEHACVNAVSQWLSLTRAECLFFDSESGALWSECAQTRTPQTQNPQTQNPQTQNVQSRSGARGSDASGSSPSPAAARAASSECALPSETATDRALRDRARSAPAAEVVPRVERRAVAGIVGYAARTSSVVNVADVAADPRWSPELDGGDGGERWLAVPVVAGDEVHAVLVARRAAEQASFTAQDEALLTHFAARAAPVFDRLSTGLEAGALAGAAALTPSLFRDEALRSPIHRGSLLRVPRESTWAYVALAALLGGASGLLSMARPSPSPGFGVARAVPSRTPSERTPGAISGSEARGGAGEPSARTTAATRTATGATHTGPSAARDGTVALGRPGAPPTDPPPSTASTGSVPSVEPGASAREGTRPAPGATRTASSAGSYAPSARGEVGGLE